MQIWISAIGSTYFYLSYAKIKNIILPNPDTHWIQNKKIDWHWCKSWFVFVLTTSRECGDVPLPAQPRALGGSWPGRGRRGWGAGPAWRVSGLLGGTKKTEMTSQSHYTAYRSGCLAFGYWYNQWSVTWSQISVTYNWVLLYHNRQPTSNFATRIIKKSACWIFF